MSNLCGSTGCLGNGGLAVAVTGFLIYCVTRRALLILGTGGSFDIPAMSDCCKLISNVGVTAIGFLTGIGGIAFCDTGRRGYFFSIVVTGCVNFLYFIVIAIITLASFFTVLGTGRSGMLIPISVSVSERSNGLEFALATAVSGTGELHGASGSTSCGTYRLSVIPDMSGCRLKIILI